MSNANLVPKRIVNSAGVETTVHVRPEDGASAANSPLKGIGAPDTVSGSGVGGYQPVTFPPDVESEFEKARKQGPPEGYDGDWEDDLSDIQEYIGEDQFSNAEETAEQMGLHDLGQAIGTSYKHQHPEEVEAYISEHGLGRTRAELGEYIDAGYSWKWREGGGWALTNETGFAAAGIEFSQKRGTAGRLTIYVVPGGPEAQSNPAYDEKFIHGVRGAGKPPTKKHRAVMGEAMLGTVWAVNRDGKVKSFDYDWAAAREYADLTPDRDVRVSKAKEGGVAEYGQHQGYRKGQRVVWATEGDQS